MRREPYAVGEWYHCYNLGIEKRTTFEDQRDYYRFMELFYLANDQFPLRRDNIGNRKFDEVLAVLRGSRLVSVGAFCIMPNHFSIVLKETREGGITSFMRKLGTAYTLYFNSRHGRIGNLFLKPFRSRHVSDNRHLEQLINYVHCSPAVLYEPDWRTGQVVDPQFLGEQLSTYPYSSLSAFVGGKSLIKNILGTEIFSIVRPVSIQKMLQDARRYWNNSNIP